MTRAEAFDKAWRLGFKGDFSLFDEIYHPDFKGVAPAADEVELNFDGFKEVLHTLKDFIVFTPPQDACGRGYVSKGAQIQQT